MYNPFFFNQQGKVMEIFAITVFVIADEVLNVLGNDDHPQSIMTNSEIITFTIISAKYFSGNHKLTNYLCKKLKLFPRLLSPSRLNRRIHQIPEPYWQAIFQFLALIFKKTSGEFNFAVDSFPVPSCQKNRIDRRKIFTGKKYFGFAASKKKYFCGIKVHLVVTCQGKPVEVCLAPGAESDVKVLWKMALDIPSCSYLYADGAYNCFDLEDVLLDEQIILLAKRGCKAKNRIRSKEKERKISSKRQIIETVFSQITSYLPRTMKVRTEKGFIIRVFCSVLAYSMSQVCNILLT